MTYQRAAWLPMTVQPGSVPSKSSANTTPVAGQAGESEVQSEVGVVVTVTVCVAVVPAPQEFEATRLVTKLPTELQACAGFRWEDVAPSPKLHAQDTGSPEEVSVKA